MADISPHQKSTVLCRYFMHNACQKGNRCSFSHDRNTPPDLICRFYLKGQCTYGDQCRYDHDRSKGKGSMLTKKSNANPKGTALKSLPNTSPQIKDKISQGAVKALSVTNLRDSEPVRSNMVSLSKGTEQQKVTSPSSVLKAPEDWVKAKEFVPGQFYVGAVPPTYASAVLPSQSQEYAVGDLQGAEGDAAAAADCEGVMGLGVGGVCEGDASLLCPYMMAKGECRLGESCTYLHGEFCDMCGLAVLHPTDLDQRDVHMKECMEAHEMDMEHSFAVAASRDKTCGICMDVILEKEPSSARRFGILENCNHCFCLNCIRQWRCAKQFEKTIVRACPECRVKSDFVTPSHLWVDSPEEKTKVIQGYKGALMDKPCRHFDQGKGECPFNDSCFYKHALPDGSIAPPQPRRVRRCVNSDGETLRMHGINLWDFLESDNLHREIQLAVEEELELMNYLALSELLDVFVGNSDSDSDSDV